MRAGKVVKELSGLSIRDWRSDIYWAIRAEVFDGMEDFRTKHRVLQLQDAVPVLAGSCRRT